MLLRWALLIKILLGRTLGEGKLCYGSDDRTRRSDQRQDERWRISQSFVARLARMRDNRDEKHACWNNQSIYRGKPDYSIPKAYRVISLLNCLGKVSERILARRLGYLAETTDLLHPSQIGGRRKKSAIDAAFLLTDEV